MILEKIIHQLETTENQFGFKKKKHTTHICKLLFNETTRSYNCNRYLRFVCFMEASKAFIGLNLMSFFIILIPCEAWLSTCLIWGKLM